MIIRRMKEGDALSVAELEIACFSDPWSENTISEGFRGTLDSFWILEDDGRISGYCCMRRIAGEGEILRIAVLPECRGCGFGKKLMDMMVGFASETEVEAITLEVRESNHKAINLYRSYGFETEAVRKAYYRNPEEAALLMWKYGI